MGQRLLQRAAWCPAVPKLGDVIQRRCGVLRCLGSCRPAGLERGRAAWKNDAQQLPPTGARTALLESFLLCAALAVVAAAAAS